MAGDWPSTQLGDVIQLLTGFPFKSAMYVDHLDAPRLLRGDNIAQGVLRWDGAKRWPQELTDHVHSYWLRQDDVVLAMDRPWIEAGLKFASIKQSDTPSLLVQRVARLRGSDRLNSHFLRYLLASRSFTEYVLGIQTGTAVPHISAQQIKEFEVALPPILEQRAIAGVLGALDDKIDHNRQTAQALERLARAIFRAWFVDFEPVKAKASGAASFPTMPQHAFDSLPTRFVDSDIGLVPEGWEVKAIARVATFLNGLALQKYPPRGDGNDLRVIKIAQLRRGSTEGADWANCDLSEKYVVDDRDLLFSWSGTLEAVLWFGGKGALNQHLFKVTAAHCPSWFCLLWIRQHLPWFRAIAASKATTMGHIRRHHLQEAQVVVPTPDILHQADAVIGSLYKLYEQLMIETRSLANLRDCLLPELLSGNVGISMTNPRVPS